MLSCSFKFSPSLDNIDLAFYEFELLFMEPFFNCFYLGC